MERVERDKRIILEEIGKMPNYVIAAAYVYAKILDEYGADVRQAWETVTEQKVALDMAYRRGRQDEADRWNRRANEKEE